MSPNDKLYVILDKYLPSGLKMAQAIHAQRAFAARHAELERSWYDTSNNICVLETPNLVKLAESLASEFELAEFREPDLDDRLTAICVAPSARRKLRRLKLAA